MDTSPLIETTVTRTVIHEGRYLRFRLDTVEDAEGRRHQREIVEHPGAVAVLAWDGEDVLLVRQFRAAAGTLLLELPAGTLDRSPDGSVEDPALAAPRELGEETGHRARTWRHLGSFFTAPGFADELMHLWLATDLEPIEGYQGPEPDEHLDLVRVPWREALRMADEGELRDAKTILGLLWLARLVDAGEVAAPGVPGGAQPSLDSAAR